MARFSLASMAVAGAVALGSFGDIGKAFADGSDNMCKPGSHSVCVPNKKPAQQRKPVQRQAVVSPCAAFAGGARTNLAAKLVGDVKAADRLAGDPRVISEQGFFQDGNVAGTFIGARATITCGSDGAAAYEESADVRQENVSTGKAIFRQITGGFADVAEGVGTYLAGKGTADYGEAAKRGMLKSDTNITANGGAGGSAVATGGKAVAVSTSSAKQSQGQSQSQDQKSVNINKNDNKNVNKNEAKRPHHQPKPEDPCNTCGG